MFKGFFLTIILLLLITSFLYAQDQAPQESDQQINDFSLAGYAEKGKKAWELSGKTADIFNEVVKLKDVIGNMYGEEEDVRLTADKGDFNKADGKVRLENNVVITTSTGTKMTTDSLNWDRKNQLVTTQDKVNIQKENMTIEAYGAKGEPSLKKVALEKDVKLDILPVEKTENPAEGLKEKITVTCDGPLEIDYEKNIATFNNNVKVEKSDSTIYSDKMDVYFTRSNKEESKESSGSQVSGSLMGSKIDKIVARGNVKVVRGENISYSDEAIYSSADRKIILNGRPKLIIYSSEELGNAPFGN